MAASIIFLLKFSQSFQRILRWLTRKKVNPMLLGQTLLCVLTIGAGCFCIKTIIKAFYSTGTWVIKCLIKVIFYGFSKVIKTAKVFCVDIDRGEPAFQIHFSWISLFWAGVPLINGMNGKWVASIHSP